MLIRGWIWEATKKNTEREKQKSTSEIWFDIARSTGWYDRSNMVFVRRKPMWSVTYILALQIESLISTVLVPRFRYLVLSLTLFNRSLHKRGPNAKISQFYKIKHMHDVNIHKPRKRHKSDKHKTKPVQEPNQEKSNQAASVIFSIVYIYPHQFHFHLFTIYFISVPFHHVPLTTSKGPRR